MATILQNSDWHNKIEVKKGDFGEELVKNCLESCGFTCYQPTTDAAHIIDFLVSQGKEFKFGVEVKTKPKFKNYPATGFNYHHYLDYKKFIREMNLPLFIAFVDEVEKKIYGNFLHVLDEPRKFCNMDYPNTFQKNGFTIRYYPMCAMLPIKNLTENEVATLKKIIGRK